jgi:fucose 4-O-acetylase-like acetyltransferase
MPTFFFASGLFATRWIHERDWRTLVNGKLALLSWVFLTWQIMMFIYKYAAARTLPGQRDDTLLAHMLRVLVAPVRPNAELWFLWALVIFFVSAKTMRNVPSPWAVAGAAALSLVWSGVVSPALGTEGLRLLGGAGSAPMYFVFFMVAERYRGTVRRVVSRVQRWQAAAVVAAWAVAIGTFDLLAPTSDTPGVTFAGQLIGVTAGVSLAVLIAPVATVRYLGRNTLPVYLTHTSLIVAFAIAYHASGAHLSGPALLVAPWLVAATVISLGLGLHRVAGDTVLFRPPAWFRLHEKHRLR